MKGYSSHTIVYIRCIPVQTLRPLPRRRRVEGMSATSIRTKFTNIYSNCKENK